VLTLPFTQPPVNGSKVNNAPTAAWVQRFVMWFIGVKCTRLAGDKEVTNTTGRF
jgi:hypothetical protein